MNKYIQFAKTYTNAFRWLIKERSIKEQVAMIRTCGGSCFMQYLNDYPRIKHNYLTVLSRLKEEHKKRKLRVCFLVSEPAKWNMQPLYDELLKTEDFFPFIVVTNVKNLHNRLSYKHILEFFYGVAKNVEVGWDETSKEGVELKQFSPDIVFYQQPWYIYSNQNIPVVSEFALPFYVSYAMEDPYIVAKSHLLDFYSLVFKYYCFNETYIRYFSSACPFKINNLVSIDGHPKLDVYADYRSKDYTHRSVIYAPHHSLTQSSLRYGTFFWSGQFLLNWAKLHPEIDWVFKPHPRFKLSLAEVGMDQKDIDAYFSEWSKIGVVYEDGNYFDIFKNSKCMITDCGAFLAEFLPTEMPIIHMLNKNAGEYAPLNVEIMKSLYKVYNVDELARTLEDVVLNQNDPLNNERIAMMEKVGIRGFHASKNIIDDMKKLLS